MGPRVQEECLYGQVWGVPTPHKLLRPLGEWSFYCSQDRVIMVPWVIGPWFQGLFGTYNSYTLHYNSYNSMMANEKCIYGQVYGALFPKLPLP